MSKDQERRLLRCFKALDPARQQNLLDYAEYLLQRYEPTSVSTVREPLSIPRPEQETVISAIKRLRETYPMVDAAALFNETSSLMAQHLMQGRASREVIDELEALFAQRFADVTEPDV